MEKMTTKEFVQAIRESGYTATLFAEVTYAEYIDTDPRFDGPIIKTSFMLSYWDENDRCQQISSPHGWREVYNDYIAATLLPTTTIEDVDEIVGLV